MPSPFTCFIFLAHIILLVFGILANYAILFLTGIIGVPVLKQNKLFRYMSTNSKVRLVRLRSESPNAVSTVCTSQANASEMGHEYTALPEPPRYNDDNNVFQNNVIDNAKCGTTINHQTHQHLQNSNSLTIQQDPHQGLISPSSVKGEDSFFRLNSTRKSSRPKKDLADELKSLKKPCHFSKSTHNFILANMAVADMLYLLAQPLIAVQMVLKKWTFGQALCKTLYGFDMAFFMMCPYFIVMISVDRLFTMYGKKCGGAANWSFTYCGIVMIWGVFLVMFSSTFIAAGLATNKTDAQYGKIDRVVVFKWIFFLQNPRLRFFILCQASQNSTDLTICTLHWADVIKINPSIESVALIQNQWNLSRNRSDQYVRYVAAQQTHTMFAFIFSYIIPLIIIFCSYATIVLKIKRVVKRNNLKSSYTSKVVNKVSIVLVVYIFTLGPYFGVQIMSDFQYSGLSKLKQEYPNLVYILWHFILFAAQANHILDPILYAFSSQKFRAAVKSYFSVKFSRSDSPEN